MEPTQLQQEARRLYDAGDYEGALRKADEAKAAAAAQKAINDLAPRPNDRPVYAASVAETPTTDINVTAIKAAYVKKFGELDSAVEQIYRELYGTVTYAQLRAAKMADVNRYLRTNTADPTLSRMVLLTPEQVLSAVVGGVPVNGSYSIKATMIEAQDTLGGVLIPEEFNQDMVQRLPGLTVVRSRAKVYTTSRDALSFLVRLGGDKKYVGNVRSKQTSESPSSGSFETNALWGKINIPVHVNLSKVPVSKSLLEDSSMDILNQVLMPEFMTEAALTEDRQFLVGTGANEPSGILIPNGTNTATSPASGITTVNSGNASAITFDSMVQLPYALPAQYRNRSATNAFAFASSTSQTLIALKDGVGQYLWTEVYGVNAQASPSTFRGIPVAESEWLPSIAANAYPVIYGDFQGYRIVDRIGMSVQRYEDSALADTDSVAFYCRRRYGGQVAEGYRFVALKISA